MNRAEFSSPTLMAMFSTSARIRCSVVAALLFARRRSSADELACDGLFGHQPTDGSTNNEASDEKSVFHDGCHGRTTTTVYDEYANINVQIKTPAPQNHAI